LCGVAVIVYREKDVRCVREVGEGVADRERIWRLHQQVGDRGPEEDDVAVFVVLEVFVFKISRACQRRSTRTLLAAFSCSVLFPEGYDIVREPIVLQNCHIFFRHFGRVVSQVQHMIWSFSYSGHRSLKGGQ
jgi:hypothetical protein